MPGLVEVDLKDTIVRFVDGTSPTPNTLELKIDEGTVKFTEKRNLQVKRDRGKLDYIKEGDEEPLEVSFEARFSAITSDSGEDVTVHEFLKKQGAASAFKSTSGDCEADAVDIEVEVHRNCGSVLGELITFEKFTYNSIGGDFKTGQLSIAGICNVISPVGIRTTLT